MGCPGSFRIPGIFCAFARLALEINEGVSKLTCPFGCLPSLRKRQDQIKHYPGPVTHPQIPRSSAHANERKKGDKSELKRL